MQHEEDLLEHELRGLERLFPAPRGWTAQPSVRLANAVMLHFRHGELDAFLTLTEWRGEDALVVGLTAEREITGAEVELAARDFDMWGCPPEVDHHGEKVLLVFAARRVEAARALACARAPGEA